MQSDQTPVATPWAARLRAQFSLLPTSGKLLIAMLCGVSMLALVFWLANSSVQQARDTAEWTHHTQEVRFNLAAVGESLLAMESGQRGYLLTGDERYFSEDQMGSVDLQAHLKLLGELVADDPGQLALHAELRRQVATRIEQMRHAVRLRREESFEAARAFVLTSEGWRTSVQIRTLLDRMAQVEAALLAQRRADEEASLQRNLLWGMALAGTALALLILSYFLVRRENAARAHAVRMLDAANVDLEARVAESVKELSASNAALKCEIEQRASAEAELQRSHELLETRVRERTSELTAATASKSRFLSAASHDLRQPLHSLTLLNATLRSQPLGELACEIVEAQRQSLDSMSKLVNSLLNISMLEAGAVNPQVRDFALQELLGTLHSEFAPLAQARGLRLQIDTCSGVAHSDPALVRQVIQNLLGNALRYTQHGTVSLTARADGSRMRLEVIDTGPGIPADQLERIFEEFHQLRPAAGQSREGFGLGLSIVRHLVKLLDIEMQLSSTVGAGTKFTLTLPTGSTPLIPQQAVVAELARAQRCGSILLLDDEAPVRNATALFLRLDGHEVTAAGSVEEAIVQLEQLGRVPDVIVSDYQLGSVMSGVDFIEHARVSTRTTIPAIVLSGDMLKVRARCERLADCRLFHKPVDAEELSRHVHLILERQAVLG